MAFSDPIIFIILCLAGAVAGFLNVLAGGGSALTIPIMIFLGFDANGSNRIAIQVEALTAVAAFKKQQHANFPLSLRLSELVCSSRAITRDDCRYVISG